MRTEAMQISYSYWCSACDFSGGGGGIAGAAHWKKEDEDNIKQHVEESGHEVYMWESTLKMYEGE